MKRILIDVDTQFDFMDPAGALYVEADSEVSLHIHKLLRDGSYDAIIGSVDSHAYDAWEFQENGGPFPAHCVKGTRGWLRVFPDRPAKQRFIPMTHADSVVFVGERIKGQGRRVLNPHALAQEAVHGNVGLYFEKEVYSIFYNQFAAPVLQAIGNVLDCVDWSDVQVDVIGYATGGYCVDAAVEGLLDLPGIKHADIRVLAYAAAAIGGAEGMAKSKEALTKLGAEWVEKP